MCIRDRLFHSIPAETMVMYRNDKDKIILSVCDPNLNISEKDVYKRQALDSCQPYLLV